MLGVAAPFRLNVRRAGRRLADGEICHARAVRPGRKANSRSQRGSAGDVPVTVQPLVVRAGVARTYDVYAISLLDRVPAAVGSAVRNASGVVVTGDVSALSAMFAIAVALRYNFRMFVCGDVSEIAGYQHL